MKAEDPWGDGRTLGWISASMVRKDIFRAAVNAPVGLLTFEGRRRPMKTYDNYIDYRNISGLNDK